MSIITITITTTSTTSTTTTTTTNTISSSSSISSSISSISISTIIIIISIIIILLIVVVIIIISSIMFIISVFLFYEYVINHYHLAIHNSFSLRTQKRASLDLGGFALLRFGLRFPLLRLNKAMRKIELPSGTQTCQMENGLSIGDCSWYVQL